MKKLLLAVLLVVIFTIGCGNGNPVTPQNDLSGLVGIWFVHLNFTGESYKDVIVTAYTITQTTVIQENGNHLASDYYGGILTLIGEEDHDCQLHEERTVNFILQIPIQPGDLFADINGTGTDWSGSPIDITGHLRAWE